MKHDYVRSESLVGRNEVSIDLAAQGMGLRVLRIPKIVETISFKLLNEQFVHQTASRTLLRIRK